VCCCYVARFYLFPTVGCYGNSDFVPGTRLLSHTFFATAHLHGEVPPGPLGKSWIFRFFLDFSPILLGRVKSVGRVQINGARAAVHTDLYHTLYCQMDHLSMKLLPRIPILISLQQDHHHPHNRLIL